MASPGLRHAGIHWPENAGGEHPSAAYILSMPGIRDGCALICSPSARYWYRQLRGACPLVVWRAIPRQGRLPAQLGWEPNKVADECLNLYDEQPHGNGVEWFLPLNELAFEKENGGPFPGYGRMAELLAGLRLQLRRKFTQQYPGATVRLMFPAWVPSDDGDHLDDWRSEATAWDALCIHCYGSAETMRARYDSYRAAFPGMPILVGEHNANHEGHDERAALEMWADVAARDPLFLGATYYIYETDNAGEHDLSIWGHPDRLALFMDPPTVQPAPIPAPEPPPMTVYEQFIRDAAAKRGIDPDIAVAVAKSEGGVDEPAAHGDFPTGNSWWAFQLHYGGAGYEQFGTVAGMGNDFTRLTGWQPGDPNAWRDATRYALNRARVGGWGAWYGAAAVGITGFMGIDLGAPWDANSEHWDFETGILPMPTPTYNPDTPLILQNDDWSCWATSARMALEAWGRHPSESWIESTTIADGIESTGRGLLDGTGAAGAAWLTRQYGNPAEGTPTITARNASSVSFDDVKSLAGQTAVLLGGHNWGAEGHWVFVRRYDPATDSLLLGNPAGTYAGIGQTMSRQQFGQVAPCSMVVVTADGAVQPAPTPPPADPRDAVIADLRRQLADKDARLADAISKLGYAAGDVASAAEAIANTLRTLAPPAA